MKQTRKEKDEEFNLKAEALLNKLSQKPTSREKTKWHHNSESVSNDLLPDPVIHATPLDLIMAMEEHNTSTSDYREASLKFLTILSLALSYILSAKDPTSAAYGVVFELGITSATGGKSQRQIAKEIGISYGSIPWHRKQFRAYSGIKL